MTPVHQPVLVEEVLRELALRAGAVVLDATVGLGGHAEAMLEASGPAGILVGLDRDPEALAAAEERLKRFGPRVRLVHGNFGEIGKIVEGEDVGNLDAVLFDLGVSSLQLDKGNRGFSFAREGPLDMRMDPAEPATAESLVNRASLADLMRIIREYGEERWAGRIARAILRERPFATTTSLAETIRRVVPPAGRHDRIDPATRTFQAIRIAVNRELELLPEGLDQAMVLLKPGGRMAVLAYHSLEDRIVKEKFRAAAREGVLRLLTRKPVRPTEVEVARNPRSRSARLRAAERLREGQER